MARSYLILVSVLMLAIVSNVWAESELFAPTHRTGSFEFTVRTCYVDPQDFHGPGGSSVSTGDDLGLGFGFAYSINERFSMGLFASWRTLDYTAHTVSAADPDNSYSYSSWLDTSTLGVSATFNILPKRLTPYVQAALGCAMVDTNTPAGTGAGCWWDPWWVYACTERGTTYSKDAVSYILGAGLSWQLTDMFFIRAGYEKNRIDMGIADDFDMFRFDVGFLYR